MPKGKPRKLTKIQKKQVKRIVNSGRELRQYHVNSTGTGVSTTVGMIKLSGVVQGDATDNRDGDDLFPTQLQLKWYLAAHASSTEPSICRFIIFQWKEDDAAGAPAATDVLQNGTTYALTDTYNVANKQIMKVLYDRVVSIRDLPDSGDRFYPQKTIRIFQKRLKRIRFNSGAITGSSHIYLMTYSGTASGSNPPQLAYSSTLYYRTG